ncbi:TRAP transporter small permease (plasmid) [Paroceanicella profunda]|uniref:TRAP transporter small permease protein n=2 Tax=Paroceanicella profunda TaxID=2579971 RepID=A0A5B8G488_9RHOB|nr:TRAP transporter small permease [Paroceanicella profunda]
MRALAALSTVLILALTLVTCVDVVGRYWFNAPLPGAFELTELMLGALVFAALPLTTRDGGHVEVDLVGMLMGARGGAVLTAFGNVFAALVLAVFAWRLGVEALRLGEDGSVTNALRLPMAPVAWFAAFACLLSAAAAVARAGAAMSHKERLND